MEEAFHSEDSYSHQVRQFHSLLMELHKDLLDYQGEIMSDLLQKKLSPYELWDMSIKDREFVWLRKLSELIIVIDEAFDDGKVEKNFVKWLKKEVNEIFFTDRISDFRSRLTVALEKRPELHFLVGRMKRMSA